MPVPPSILGKIQAIRKFISSGGTSSSSDPELHILIHKLFQNPDKIVSNPDSLDAILAFAVEFENYRGKGSQYGTREFYERLHGLVYHAPPDLPATDSPWLEKLAAHLFQRVQGPRVRSERAARLRANAWAALGSLSVFSRNPEHLAHALVVAADTRAGDAEREAAVMFLSEYWEEENPDQATVDLLFDLERNPPDRSFLVTVLQTQIELGLNDEFGALCAVDAWDDAEEE